MVEAKQVYRISSANNVEANLGKEIEKLIIDAANKGEFNILYNISHKCSIEAVTKFLMKYGYSVSKQSDKDIKISWKNFCIYNKPHK